MLFTISGILKEFKKRNLQVNHIITVTGNYLFTGTMAEKHDKYSGFSVALPCHGYSTNINTYYDTDVYPHYGTAAEQYEDLGFFPEAGC